MRSLLLLAGLLTYGIALAQTSPPSQQFKVHQLDKARPGNMWVAEPPGDREKQLASDTLRLIVRLKGDIVNSPDGRQGDQAIREQHARFRDDLSRLSGNASTGRASLSPTTIHYEYSNTFNGFAITASQAVAEDIRKLSYVARVTEDQKVEASHSENNALIRAPQVWQDFGVTGKNITIGILDTGIDYNHPDLGQGFGPSYKVSSGYDFVNNDSDPMDDHGHGTHVAGIAAANGVSFKGVAPDAKLVAYKVLNQYGFGYDSWILAAIERCADPDQDPATDDAIDVVNMSLGRVPDPEEPLSEAVNNAIAKGVVFSIAAGNRGDYLTIDAPGTAENAITVGATDNYKQTAYFSSKGPTESLRFKPDVSAPGTDINSTFLNQQYQSFSGTSMASPHVAGAVALLLEKKPHLTPEMVKNLLMGTARSVSPVLWDQGAGLIDIYDAINAPHFATPGSIHFGTVDPSPSFLKTVTLTVTNADNATKTFDLTAEGIISHAPFTLTIAPASFTLNAHETRAVELTLSAASEVAPQNLPDAYTGSINIKSGASTIKTPLVLLNPQKTVLNFTGPSPGNLIVIGIEGSYYWRPFQPQPEQSALELYLPKAKYDILVHYDGGSRTVIAESVNTEKNVTLTLDRSLAKNVLAFKPLDKDGNPIDLTNYASGNAIFSGEDRNIMTLFPWGVDSLYVSDTEHYKYEFKYNAKAASGDEYYEIVAGTGTGIMENKVCSNDPSAFSNITIHNPSIPPGASQHMTFYVKSGSPYSWFTSWNNYPIEMPATFTLLQTQHHPLTQTQQQLPGTGYIGSFATLSPLPEQSGYVWETADIRAEEGNTIGFYQHIDRKILTVEEQHMDYVLGRTIPNFILIPDHQPAALRYSTFLGRGAFNRSPGERERGTVNYTLYHGGTVVKTGNLKQSINNDGGSAFPEIDVTPGTYQLDFEYRDFQTGGKFGVARLSTVFNTEEDMDRNPPYLKSLRLLANGRDTNEFDEGATALVRFTISDCSYESCGSPRLKNTSASIKHADDPVWTSLALEAQTNTGEFSANLPSGLGAGYYSLQVTSEDPEGNKFSYEVSPAFLIGARVQPQAYAAINLIAPKNYSINAGTSPVFRWSDIDATSYTIQISEDPNFTANVVEANATDATHVLTNPLEENRTHYWRVKAAGDNTSGLWSSVFQFESRLLPTAVLLAPGHESVVPFSVVDFSWSLVPNAYRYVIEVSHSPDFSSLDRIEYTDQTRVSIAGLFPNNKYYWRVKSYFFHGWSDEESLSPVFEFNTEHLSLPTLLHPVHESLDQPLSVMFDWASTATGSGYYFELSTHEDFSNSWLSVGTQDTFMWVETLQHDTWYYWRVTPEFYGIPQIASAVNTFRTATVTGVEAQEETPMAYGFPNPFTQETDIAIHSEAGGDAELQIIDPLGRKIKSIALLLKPGKNIVHWDGCGDDRKPSGSGIYHATVIRRNGPPLAVRLVRTK
ncbi:MAG: S8 family serine peptidase [Chryseosolibacter sp.]